MAVYADSNQIKITATDKVMLMKWGVLQPSEEEGASPGPGPRWGHTMNAVSDGQFLYVFGGYGKDLRRTNQVHVFDSANRRWTEPEVRGTPPTPRDSHSCTTIGNNLYVFGGTDGTRTLNDLHILNTQTLCWTKPYVRGTRPKPRAGHIAASFKKKLYIFGGCGKSEDGDIYYNDVYILGQEYVWKRVTATPSSPSKRVNHSCFSWNQFIYVIGGEDSCKMLLSDVYVLDAENLLWHKLKTTGELLPPRAGHTTVGFSKFIIVFGGYSQLQKLYDDVYVLDIEHSKWIKIAATGICPSGRFLMAGDSFAPVDVGGVFAFFGGCNENLEPLGDMYYLDTGNYRTAWRKSLRKQLEWKSQAQPVYMSRFEAARAKVEREKSNTIHQPMPKRPMKTKDGPNQFSIEDLSSIKTTYKVTVTNSFPDGYIIETTIWDMPFHGVLVKYRPILLTKDPHGTLEFLKTATDRSLDSYHSYYRATVQSEDVIMQSEDVTMQSHDATMQTPNVTMQSQTSEDLSSFKKTFEVTVTNAFSEGYNIETLIHDMPYQGVLFKYRRVIMKKGTYRPFKAMKTTTSGSPHSSHDVTMQSHDVEKEPKESEAQAKDSVAEMKNPIAAGSPEYTAAGSPKSQE